MDSELLGQRQGQKIALFLGKVDIALWWKEGMKE